MALRRSLAGWALCLCFALQGLVPALARGDAFYEDERMSRALASRSLRKEPEPEGKRIAFVRIERENVFVKDEFYPTFFNIFHWKTRESVVERELLFEEGDLYQRERVEETMRILRSMGIFSLVRIVAVQTGRPGEVGVLVYTRDLWSLRLETDFQVTGKVIDRLLLQATERNFLGRQKLATARFFMQPYTWQVGQLYVDRRLGGSNLRFGENADFIFNRYSGNFEGGTASLSLRRPFYNLQDRFGFSLDGTFSNYIERRISNGRVVGYDIPETPEQEAIPSVWDRREGNSSLLGYYRVGSAYKLTFGAGWSYDQLWVAPNSLTGLAEGQEASFARDVLPRQRRQTGPVFTYQLFTPRFVIFRNLDSFGQSENVRVGPRVEATVRFPLEAFGSSSNSMVFWGLLNYALAGHDALAESVVTATARLENGRVVDQRLTAELRGASPMLKFVRLVARLSWDGRRQDTSRTQVSLGGDNGLRGFVSQAFFARGASLVRFNFEVRSRPLAWRSVHVGGVLFYDTGAVYQSLDRVTFHHAVGLGARFMLPQFNRLPFRGDVGFPVGDDFGVVPSFGSDQVIQLTAPDSVFGF